jgi:hypothetical protein
MLSLLGELRAGGDWAALAAEHWLDQPPSTPAGPRGHSFLRAARERGPTRRLARIDLRVR